MMNNYLYLSNDIKYELKEYLDIYEIENAILSYIKCELLTKDIIENFNYYGNEVIVIKDDNKYILNYLNYQFHIVVYDRQIISYSINYI